MMQDEIWMRNWNDAHPRFSADLDRGLACVAKAVAGLLRKRGHRDAAPRKRIGLG